MVLFEEQVLDWTGRLYLTIHPEDRRKTKLRVVLEIMLRVMALSLKLEEGSFVDQFGEPMTIFTRFNYYARCPEPDVVLGLKPHSDGSALTIELPDKEVEGLQFLREGKWVGIRIIPEALVINVGDQVEIMSNGVFKVSWVPLASPVPLDHPVSVSLRASYAWFAPRPLSDPFSSTWGLVLTKKRRQIETISRRESGRVTAN